MKYEMRGTKQEVYRKLIQMALLQEVDMAIHFEVPRIDTKSGVVHDFPMSIQTDYTDGVVRVITSVREMELLNPMQMMALDIESAVFNVTREGFEKYDVDLGIMLAYDRFHKAVYGFNASVDAKRKIMESVDSECMKYTDLNLNDLITKNLKTPSGAPSGANGRTADATICDEFGTSEDSGVSFEASPYTGETGVSGTQDRVNSGDETTSDDRDRSGNAGTGEAETQTQDSEDTTTVGDTDGDNLGTNSGTVVNPPTESDMAEAVVYESSFTTLGKMLGFLDHEVRDDEMNVVGIQYEEAYYRLWLLHNNTRTLFSRQGELILSLDSVDVAETWKLYEEFKEANPTITFVHDVL